MHRPKSKVREKTLTKGQKEIIRIIKETKDFFPTAKRPGCVFILEMIRKSNTSAEFNRVLGFEVSKVKDIVHAGGQLYASREIVDEIILKTKEIVNSGNFEKLIALRNSCYRDAKNLLDIFRDKKETDIERLKRFIAAYTKLSTYLLTVNYYETALGARMSELVKNKVGTVDERFYNALAGVRKFSGGSEELIALLKLAEDLKAKKLKLESSAAKKKLKAHATKYFWLGSRWHLEADWTEDDFRERLENYLKINPTKELKKIYQSKEQPEKITQEFIKKYKLSKTEIEYIDLVKEFVYLRTFRSETLNKAGSLAKPLLQKIAQKLGLTFADLISLTSDEILAMLSSAADHRLKVKPRTEGFYVMIMDDNVQIFAGDEREHINELGAFLNPLSSQVELRGQVGWRGSVRGRVRVVLDEGDIKKVKKGEILVAIMTFPNYVPAMEKATGFVTDEGGILCHAAIISREMQKPCIIGTKDATRVLKNGDLVELDGETGIVRKIK
ncbi:MAG: PEP-utilizing enzyme [Candidatus Moranbacteria bacterium]|nr:PEP-utilizing enzyme [Candidatus Moranbacteria bacterium]